MEGPFSALRIDFDGLENQLSALQLARSSEQEEVDPDDSELTAGLFSVAAARFEGVTMRESHTKLESPALSVRNENGCLIHLTRCWKAKKKFFPPWGLWQIRFLKTYAYRKESDLLKEFILLLKIQRMM